MKEKKKERGITLIALVITIIVLLILATISIASITGNNGILNKAEEAKFKNKMATYNEKANLYASWQITETGNTDISWINAGNMLENAVAEGFVNDITQDDIKIEIGDILEGIEKKEERYLAVYKGELYYVSNKNTKNNEIQEKWCREIGIKILEYIEPPKIAIRNGNYELVNGVYLCTPKLDTGFVKEKTRYIEEDKEGDMVPGNWIIDNPSETWYDYKSKKWANIHVENNGMETYYVWIPRYCFRLDTTGQRSDVKFIDTNNNYKDPETDEVTTAEELKNQGYQVPEAFTFNEQALAGYWVMKYTAGDNHTPSIINYDMSVSKGQVTIRNITLNTEITNQNTIVKYTVALNGKIIQEITDHTKLANIGAEVITFRDLRAGNNTINITGLNEKGEIVGSMTKEYAPAVVNKPDTSGFNQDTTFYVTYDENGKEHSTIPVKEEMPKYWYEYGESRWANIVTRNNEAETYYVWIPRYSFQLNVPDQRSQVKFIEGTTRETEPGYQIPEAFTFAGKEITGYWAMKYTAGDVGTAKFNTELMATGKSIIAKGVTGTGVATGQVYKYYINGKYDGETTNASTTYEYKNLQPYTQYTVQIEIRNSSTDDYLGSIVKQVKTIDANPPDLSGFKEEYTYYVLYDDQGKESLGEKIKKDRSNMPENWYDYSKCKWANIVVKANNKTTYFTWIPRYQFRLDTVGQRSIVEFLEGTDTTVKAGYQIPEAFKFNGKPLTGYWAMKYTAGD